MKVNKLILYLILFSLISLLNINSDDIGSEKIKTDWKKHEIIVDGFSPFIIYLPKLYEIEIGNNVNGYHVLHQIYFNDELVGGISIGNFEPDNMLWGIDEKSIINVPILIFNNICQLKFFNNVNRIKLDSPPYIRRLFIFEACLIDYSDNPNEKYFDIFGYTDNEQIKNELIKSFSTIKEYE
ncbi:MAG: hypothetical protein LBK73_00505 [Treponema sp.]|nr:hypothetical protein [Treponema sp.]